MDACPTHEEAHHNMLHACINSALCRKISTTLGRSLEDSQKVRHLQCVLILPSDSIKLGRSS